MRRLVLLILVTLSAPAWGQDLPSVSGTALYRGRMALPDGAVFEATLEAVPPAGGPGEVVGRYRAGLTGRYPIPFAISYDTARIDPALRYVLRARLMLDAVPIFETRPPAPILTQGAPDRLDVLLERITQPAVLAVGALPASYEGELPCVDRPGIRHQLSLLADQSFRLRLTYRDRGPDSVYDQRGLWSVTRDGRILRLRGGGKDRMMLLAVDRAGTLTMLDAQGKSIVSLHNYALKRLADYQPLAPRAAAAKLRGTPWQLAQVRESDGLQAPARSVFLTFSARGEEVSGTAGCTSLQGSFSATDAWLALKLRAIAGMPCGGTDAHGPLVAIAPRVARYVIDDKMLELQDNAGETLAVLETR